MDLFEKYNLKRTKTRQIIVDALVNNNKPVSCEELYKQLSKNHSINLATIYRNLNTLSEIDFINKIVRQDGIAYYSLKHIDAHFMVCDICNKQIPLDHCPLDDSFTDQIEKNNFKPTGHVFEIHGICKNCQIVNNPKEKVGE